MCGIKGVISDTEYGLQNYQKIWHQTLSSEKAPDLEFVAFRGADFEPLEGVRTFSFENFRDSADSSFQNEREKIISNTQCDENVNIQFTSGTTGHPKGATLTHHNILNSSSSLFTDLPNESCLCNARNWVSGEKNDLFLTPLALLSLIQYFL